MLKKEKHLFGWFIFNGIGLYKAVLLEAALDFVYRGHTWGMFAGLVLPRTKPRLTACKASALTPILPLQPCFLFLEV